MDAFEIHPIAHIVSDFEEKFGIPRQSGRQESVAEIVFTPPYRDESALRGIEDFSHLWLIWGFSKAEGKDFSPTVRPPRLGGNRRMGVFATRSPYRPNRLGLSSVTLKEVKKTADRGTVLVVCGADLLDGTPIYDIKPYLAYTDSHPEAQGGFADDVLCHALEVRFSEGEEEKIPASKRAALRQLLSEDPRPGYQEEGRVYGMRYAGHEIGFFVKDGVLTVTSVQKGERK